MYKVNGRQRAVCLKQLYGVETLGMLGLQNPLWSSLIRADQTRPDQTRY